MVLMKKSLKIANNLYIQFDFPFEKFEKWDGSKGTKVQVAIHNPKTKEFIPCEPISCLGVWEICRRVKNGNIIQRERRRRKQMLLIR
jgi:hypothetical protein